MIQILFKNLTGNGKTNKSIGLLKKYKAKNTINQTSKKN
jgi:hypothetical protein